MSEGLAKDERRIIAHASWRKLAACAHTLHHTLWQTFRVCQSFLYPQFKIHNYFVYLHKIIDKDKMVEFSFKVKGNSAPALAFIAYAKTLNFIEFDTPEKIVQAEPATTEDNEHYDFIMSLSKKTNKKVAARLAKEKNIILPSQKNKI